MSKLLQPTTNVKIVAAKEPIGIEDPIVLLIGGYKYKENAILDSDRKIIENATIAKAGQIIKNVNLSNINDYFGKKSYVTYAARKFLKLNTRTRLDVMALEYPNPQSSGGVKNAVAEIQFEFNDGQPKASGTTVRSGDISFYIFDDQFKVTIKVEKNQTIDDILNNLVAALKDSDIPIEEIKAESIITETSGSDTTNIGIKITSYIPGSVINNAWIRIENPHVLELNITDSVATGGVGELKEPDNLFEDIQDRYRYIVFDRFIKKISMEQLLNIIEHRLSLPSEIKTGIGIVTDNTSKDKAEEYAKLRNDRAVVYFFNNCEISESSKDKTTAAIKKLPSRYNMLPLLHSVEIAAYLSLRMTTDAMLENIIVNPTDRIGGMDKASLPFKNTPLTYLNSYDDLEFSLKDTKMLEKEGVNLIGANGPGGSVLLRELNTLSKKDEVTQEANFQFQNLTSVEMSIVAQEYFHKTLSRVLQQTRFYDKAPRGLVSVPFVTPNILRSELIKAYSFLRANTIVDVSEESLNTFVNSITITKNASTKTLNVNYNIMLPSVINVINSQITVKII